MIISIPLSYVLFLKNTNITKYLAETNKPLYTFLKNKWFFDEFYEYILVKPCKSAGHFFWKKIDNLFIDRFGPDGISLLIKKFSQKAVKFQSGYIYQYAFIMLLGFSVFLTILIIK